MTGSPDTLFNLALLCQDTGDLRESLTLCLRVTKLDPSNAAAFNNLGTTHQHLGQFEEAATAYRTAIALNPGHIGAYCNLAAALAEGDQIKDSLTVCEEALEKWPGHSKFSTLRAMPMSKRRIGMLLWLHLRHQSTMPPNLLRPGKSLILLTQAKLEQAWPEFEWRVRQLIFGLNVTMASPFGMADHWPKKLCWFIGSKDLEISFSFAAYLPLIKSLDAPPARLFFDCPDKLIPLFTDWDCLDELADFGDTPPEVDYFIPLMSLPGELGTTLETIPAAAISCKSALRLFRSPATEADDPQSWYRLDK